MNWEPRVLVVTVTVAGTPVQPATFQNTGTRFSPSVKITAKATNTGDECFYGGTDYDANHRRAIATAASITLPEAEGKGYVIDMSLLKFDSDTNGDKLEVEYLIPAPATIG